MENGARLTLRIVLGLFLSGCSDPAPGPTTPRCVPGATNACLCSGGLSGVQVCEAAGTYGACACGSMGPDAAAPTDGSAVGDAAMLLDAPVPTDAPVAQDSPALVDTDVLADARPLDVPGGSDVAASDTTPEDAVTTDASPGDASASCGALPTTATVPTRVMLASQPITALPPMSIAFTPGGLLGIGGGNDFGQGSVTLYTSDGFARDFTRSTGFGSAQDIRFLSDTLVVTSRNTTPSPYFAVSDATRTVLFSNTSAPAIAVDRTGGVFYISSGRLFRTSVGTVGPGELVASDLMSPWDMAFNADRSALFFTSIGSSAGVYRVALRRDASGALLGGAPTLYLAPSLVRRPTGLAVDVCGNLYTADVDGRVIWRIPPGPTPEQAGPRLVAIVSGGSVGRPVFGVGPGFDATRLYFLPSGGGSVLSAPAGVMGVPQ